MPAIIHLFVPEDAVRVAAERLGAIVQRGSAGPVLSAPLSRLVTNDALETLPIRALRASFGPPHSQHLAKHTWWGTFGDNTCVDRKAGIEVRSHWLPMGNLVIEAVPARRIGFEPGAARLFLAQLLATLSFDDPVESLL